MENINNHTKSPDSILTDIENLINDILIKSCEEQGFPYKKDTPECFIFLEEHNQCCNGCPTEIACCKIVRTKRLPDVFSLYQPKDFEEFQKMLARCKELSKMIHDAKTMDELIAIPEI